MNLLGLLHQIQEQQLQTQLQQQQQQQQYQQQQQQFQQQQQQQQEVFAALLQKVQLGRTQAGPGVTAPPPDLQPIEQARQPWSPVAPTGRDPGPPARPTFAGGVKPSKCTSAYIAPYNLSGVMDR